MFEINSIEDKGRTEVNVKKFIDVKGIYFCIFELNNGNRKIAKLIIE